MANEILSTRAVRNAQARPPLVAGDEGSNACVREKRATKEGRERERKQERERERERERGSKSVCVQCGSEIFTFLHSSTTSAPPNSPIMAYCEALGFGSLGHG